MQPFVVYTVTFLIFFEHDYSLKLSIGIIMMNHHGASTIKKVIVFKKQFFFAKTDNSLFRKKKYKTSLLVIRSLLAAAPPPPRFLLTSIFDESRKIVLKWKIVQNYKTSWKSSKFIDIYNIRDDNQRWYPVSNESRAIFSFLTVHSLTHYSTTKGTTHAS